MAEDRTADGDAGPTLVKSTQQANFDGLAARLGATALGRRVRFLNFGYEALPGEDDPAPELPPRFANPESARLLHAVVGDTDLAGRLVLEVGCGRGGNLGLVAQLAPDATLVGADLSEGSLRGASAPQRALVQADAERLPVRTAAVGAVLSIESACTYPDVERFYREVARTLEHGGAFLYADIVPAGVAPALAPALSSLGLEVLVQRDITANVLAARATRAREQLRAVVPTTDDGDWSEYLGTEGSFLHDALATGRSRYELVRARRTDAPSQQEAALSAAHRDEWRAFAASCAEVLARPRG